MTAPPGFKRCPECAEDVREQALVCRFCGYDFTEPGPQGGRLCPVCGEGIPSRTRVCSFCHYKPTSRWVIAWAVALAVVAAVGVTVFLAGSGRRSGRQLQGAITLRDSDGVLRGAVFGCAGKGGYADIKPGAAVTVKNEGGKIIATSSLDAGEATDSTECRLPFDVRDLPEAKFYRVEVSHRGGVTHSAAELEGRGWEVSLSLGTR